MKKIQDLTIYNKNNTDFMFYNMTRYDDEDFAANSYDEFMKKAYDMELAVTKIVLSHEWNKSEFKEKEIPEKIQLDLYQFFFGNEESFKSKIYFLENKQGEPISFMICSHENHSDHWHVELAYTDKERAGEGFGGMLLEVVAKDLQREGVNYLTATVNNKNGISMSMMERFGKENNIKTFKNGDGFRSGLEFDISKINEPRTKNDDGFGK